MYSFKCPSGYWFNFTDELISSVSVFMVPEQLVCKAKEKLLEAKCAFVLLQHWILKHSNQRLVLCVFF